MKGKPQQQSQGMVFAIIYLLITIAIGVGLFQLRPSGVEYSLVLPEDERVIAKTAPTNPSPVPTKNHNPNPGLPKPTPSLNTAPKSEPASEKKPDDTGKETKTDTPVEVAEKKQLEPEPEPAGLSPEQEREIEELYPFPKIQPLIEIVDNWQNIPQKAFPKLVAISKPVSFDMSQGGATVARGTLPIGSMMVPLRLVGKNLILRTAGAAPIQVTLPVSDTDFIESIQRRYDLFVEQTNGRIIAQRDAERSRRLGVAAHEVEVFDWNDGSDPRFEPAKTSLQHGEVATYSLIDASKWRWGGTESIEGVDYETAFVLIVSEAAFGVTERELKVLIKDGKAVRWIDPSTGETI